MPNLLKYLLCLVASFACALPAKAQIIPDATLPVNSTITSNGNSIIIEGGTSAAGNLLHSFQEFSVPTGGEAFFNNAATVENILTRVTGDNISNIDGTLRANGSANLFVLNPNGIVFGTNARLNIGGSFLGTTANSVIFENGLEFSASSPAEQESLEQKALLTVNVPIGLQFGGGTGDITVSGPGHGLQISLMFPVNTSSFPPSVAVATGRTLALIGNNISADGGLIGASGGRVELAGVDRGRVFFSLADASFTYDSSAEFGDLFLDRQSLVNVSGAPSGSISLQGRNIALENESLILSQNTGADAGGSVTLRARAELNVGQSSLGGFIGSDNLGSGRGSDVTVVARRMRFRNGGSIASRTFGMGNSGNILVQSEDITLAGSSPFDLQLQTGFLTANFFGSGNASDIRIDTTSLRVLEGASITSASFGVGNGGNLDIAAEETIEILGQNPISLVPSFISSTAFNRGNVGSTFIQTERLVLGSGGSLGSFTLAAGDTGNTKIGATSIEVTGTGTDGQPSGITSSAVLLSVELQQLFGFPPEPSGRSGALIVDTDTLRVTDGARVGVLHEGTGDAGDFTLRADTVLLDRSGSITAETVSGQGGNLVLQMGLLQLRNGSRITVEAGGSGDGGNLTIDAGTVALLEGSRVTANAFEGNGGNISIATSGIFSSTNSSITASSQFGVDGLISITNPEVDSTTGLVELAQSPRGESDRIVTGCAAAQGSSFTVVGRGGLPPNPEEQLIGDRPWADLRDLSTFRGSATENILPKSPGRRTQHRAIVEANSWLRNEEGEIELVAVLEVAIGREPGLPTNCMTNDG